MSFRCEEIKEFLSYFVRCHHNDFVLFFYSQPPRRKTARNIIRWPSVGTTRKFKIIFSHFRKLMLSNIPTSCKLKRLSGTKRSGWHIWYHLKRFPRTTSQKTATTCAENVLIRTTDKQKCGNAFPKKGQRFHTISGTRKYYYPISAPLCKVSAGVMKRILPSPWRAIRIIPLDSMPKMVRGFRFARMQICLPTISSVV